eukprot:TRINITY_DN26022_c0_g1_i1.p2 TRINITY_DN26022_c0_g1~~TRINITY_DN26022_c0_g1_i1.p2  ORF type:complete len:126 (+),score=1.49 TRINITY_DN26022_c0_g1_i1:142-519(+)
MAAAAIPLAEMLAAAVSAAAPYIYSLFAAATIAWSANRIAHIVTAEHNFDKPDTCGERCVRQVGESNKPTGHEQTNTRGTAVTVDKTGTCSHGCSITIRFTVECNGQKLSAITPSTGWHNGPCRA